MNTEPLPEQLQSLLTEWENEENELRRKVNRKAVWQSGYCILFVWMAWDYWQRGKHWTDIGHAIMYCILGVAWLTLRFSDEKRVFTKRQETLLHTIAGLRHPDLLSLLFSATDKSGIYSAKVLGILTVQLRELKASDAPEYAKYSEQIAKLAYLHITCTRNGSTKFRLFAYAALKALQQIGTKDAIPYVEKIATLDERRYNAKNVILGAQECLPYLYQRAENQHAEQTLLRASKPEMSSNILLRPVAASETPSNELLRATNEI